MITSIKDEFIFMPKSKIKAGEGIENGDYPFFTSSDIKVQTLDRYSFDDEMLIIGTGGKASCNYYNGKFAVSTDNFVLKSKGGILPKYLFYFLRRDNLSVLEKGFRGAGLKHLSKGYLSNLTFEKISQAAQVKIIESFDSLYRIIEQKQIELQNYDELIKSRFIELFGDPIKENY